MLLTIYTTTWCPDCTRTKMHLSELGLSPQTDYEEIDIEQDLTATKTVEKLNNGNRSVPTLVFSDGSVLTEPSKEALLEKIAQLTQK